MRGSVLGSTLVHVALIAALVMVPHRTSIVIPGPDVVQVSLLEPEAPAVTAPPAEPPKPRPVEKPPVKPTEEEGVKIAPVKKPEPPPEKPREPERREEPPPAALPYAAVGSAGLKAQVAVETPDFEFTYYLVLVRNKIVS